MDPQKTPNGQSDLEKKNKDEGITLPDFLNVLQNYSN